MKDINRSQIERLMANKYPIFPICIPSYKRWDRKANTTLSKIIENCDEEIQRNTYVFSARSRRQLTASRSRR